MLAGASLHLDTLGTVGLLTAGYVVLRVVGRLVGAWSGARLGGAPPVMRRWMGLALLPQAGVAIGMALFAADRFPELRDTVVPLVLASTVVFELTGPVVTRWVLYRVGEAGRAGEDPEPA